MSTARTLRTLRALLLAAAAAGAAACAAQPAAIPAGPPAPDPDAVEARLVSATTPEAPRQVSFAWELDEAGSRVRGRGVVRMEAPERLRLDLFGPRGETYLAAALVGDSFRVPPAVASRFALPSPALLWGALGVVRPPSDARLASATASADAATLRYELPGGETLEYAAEGERLRTVRRVGSSGALETIALTYSPSATLERAEYRDPRAYRTLTLQPQSIEDVAAFPEATWLPAGTR